MPYTFDRERFAQMVRQKRGAVSLRDASDAIRANCGDVSPSTLSRVERGHMPDMDTFLWLCDWLDLDGGTFFRGETQDYPGREIALRILSDPTLEPATARVLAVFIRVGYRHAAEVQATANKERTSYE